MIQECRATGSGASSARKDSVRAAKGTGKAAHSHEVSLNLLLLSVFLAFGLTIVIVILQLISAREQACDLRRSGSVVVGARSAYELHVNSEVQELPVAYDGHTGLSHVPPGHYYYVTRNDLLKVHRGKQKQVTVYCRRSIEAEWELYQVGKDYVRIVGYVSPSDLKEVMLSDVERFVWVTCFPFRRSKDDRVISIPVHRVIDVEIQDLGDEFPARMWLDVSW